MSVDSRSRVENILNVILDQIDPSVLEPAQSRVEALLLLLEGKIEDLADLAGKLPIHICIDGEYNPLTGMPTISNPKVDIFYLVPSGSGTNVYDEWVYSGTGWEQFGGGGTGILPNFSIGTVTTLPEGSQATVTLTGTMQDPVLNFGLPEGQAGDEYTVLVQAQQPVQTSNKLWINPGNSDIVEVPTYEEFEEVVQDVTDLKSQMSDALISKSEVKSGSLNDVNDCGWYKINSNVTDKPVMQDGYLLVYPFDNNKVLKVYYTAATWNSLGNYLYCIYKPSTGTFDKAWNIPNDQLENQNVMIYGYPNTNAKPVIEIDTVNHTVKINECKILSNTKELTPAGAGKAPTTTLTLTSQGASIWYDFSVGKASSNTFILRGPLDKFRSSDEVLICRLYNWGKTISCNCAYTIDGMLFGYTPTPAELDTRTEICPNYTYRQITLSNWSDFCFIGGKIWFFAPSGDEVHTSTSGAIYICDKETLAVEKTITHNLGHMNTCDYDPVTDRLVVGNLPNNATTNPPAAYIFYDVSDWEELSSVDWETVNKTVIDLRVDGYTNATEVSACWGQTNLAYRNELMIAFQNGDAIERILLGMGSNEYENGTYAQADTDKFNGTFKILHYAKNGVHEKNVNSAIQGATYYKGQMFTCNGDGTSSSSSGDFTARSTLFGFDKSGRVQRQLYAFPIYNASGVIYNQNSFTEGIAVDEDGSVLQGIITMQDGSVKKYIIQYTI